MKKILSLLLALALCAGLSVPALAAEFSDVPAGHTFHDAIQDCAAKGITSGYADGSFRPGNNVTRAQFCVMLSRAFYPEALQENSTEANKALGWFVPSTEALAQAGVLKNTLFASPDRYQDAGAMDQPIIRYDMAQLMTNIMAQKGASASEAEKAAAAEKITDWPEIHDDYRDAVSNVFALGIIGGYSGGYFTGSAHMNRGQGCVVIYRMAQYMGSETPKTPEKAPEKTPEKAPEKTPEKAPEKTQTPAEAAAELFRLVNAERAKAGLKALESMDSLTKAAQLRAKDLSGGYFETRADGSDWSTALETAGVKMESLDNVDESVAGGEDYDSPADTLKLLLSTPGAKAALMNKDFTHLGVGYVHDEKGYGGAQDFWSLLYITKNDGKTPAETPSKTPEKTPEPETPAPETPAPSGSDLQSMRQGVLDLVNAARAENGKSPLTLNDALCDVAQLRADEIVESFSHTRPDGSSCFTAINQAGISYRTVGENIAAGQSSPASVMNSWMNSEGHRKNILNGSFTSIGIGYVKAPSGYGHYWVQMFMG